MKQVTKIAIILSAAALLLVIIVLARYLYTEINRLKVGEPYIPQNEQVSTSTPDAPTTTRPALGQAPELTQELCESAGGRWNACGSPCRAEPPGTVCAEVCVEYCECGGEQGFTCPSQYSCTDLVPSASDPAAVGICKKSESASNKNEFISPDDWTSFVLANGTDLSNPFTFYGTSTAFENNINWRLEDTNGVQISSGYANVNSPDIGEPGPFSVTAFFDIIPATKTGKLYVFETSARDGSEIHKAEAEVTFPEQTQTVKIYFGNSEKTPEGQECESVYPVERMVVSGNSTAIAIHEVLKGPSLLEEKANYYTSLPANIPDPEIIINEDSIRLDFSNALEYQVAGSCRVNHIYTQLTQTAKNATNTENIVISIDGRIDDILQP